MNEHVCDAIESEVASIEVFFLTWNPWALVVRNVILWSHWYRFNLADLWWSLFTRSMRLGRSQNPSWHGNLGKDTWRWYWTHISHRVLLIRIPGGKAIASVLAFSWSVGRFAGAVPYPVSQSQTGFLSALYRQLSPNISSDPLWIGFGLVTNIVSIPHIRKGWRSILSGMQHLLLDAALT
jgi:hypothetical protein